jgi:hypothetical protein
MTRSVLAITSVLLCVTAAIADKPRRIDFQRDIKPLLARSCLACHGPEKQRGGLRLDSRLEALKGGNSGSVLRPGDAANSQLFRIVAGLDPELKMPPQGKPSLTKVEIALVRAWIDQGLHWPTEASITARPTTNHWFFRAPRQPPLPAAKDTHWPRNAIDYFVLARLEKEGLAPSAEADRATLIRRLSLDLIGLPPAPGAVDAFLADRRPDAYERVVNRLLASPAYGERWGRHWLDAARYADSDGYEKDSGRPFAWRWREWVLGALNRDLPYDRFVVEQLAGDLLPGATLEQKVATGFHRNTLTNREGGVDQEQYRVEAVVDRVNTTARVFLGLTLGCAQCHDHKYDPFSQREYYQFFAFFNSDVEANIPAPTKQLLAQTLALGKPRKTYVMVRGDFLRKGAEVQPGGPAILPPLRGKTRLDLAKWIAAPENPLTSRVLVNWVWHKYFGRGLVTTPEDFGTQGERPSHPELLDWLATELIHRGWSLKELHRLIVTSATYRQSSKLRPELARHDPLNVLLARQARQRLEAESVRDVALSASGLLVRVVGGPSVRPPQPPGISELTYAGSARWVESKGPDRYRRGLYIWFQRTSPYPMLLTFDAPDSNVCCVRRDRTNTPLQALTLMNDAVFVECARNLGQRIIAERPGASVAERVSHGFRLCLGRVPTDRETRRLAQLYEELLALCRDDPAEAAKLAGKAARSEGAAEVAAWVALARALMNLDEFIMRE